MYWMALRMIRGARNGSGKPCGVRSQVV
uniref:Uncharacterized protein n=1 Tax=Arundo donax TaxID=35708 RepID=A0A0A9DZC6_ARUDO